MSEHKLYLVATPIGNLSDMSQRAIDVLESVDFVAAEDTRNTMKLFNKFGIKKPMVSYFEHNKRERGEYIVSRIENGENCALVTDAGTPAISDPGEDIVKLCAEKNVDVVPIPGACAFVQALIVSGLDTGRFSFEGFLSVNSKRRKEHLDEVKNDRRTLVFYEAPHKLCKTLSDMLAAFGDRRISLSRELTKLHEETLRMTLSEAVAYYRDVTPKGEFVIVIEGASEVVAVCEDPETVMRELLAKGMSKTEAAKETAKRTGIPKSEAYKLAVK